MSRIFTAPLAAVLILVFASPVLSATGRKIVLPEGVDTLVMPAGSTLTFKAFNADGGDGAKFDGAVVVSGTYYYGDVFDDGSGDDPGLFIVPDRATLAHLPHFKVGHAPQAIRLSNGAAFAKAVLSPQTIAALKKGDTGFVSGKISIRADKFEAGVSCHDPYMSGRFVSVEAPAKPFKAAALPPGDC